MNILEKKTRRKKTGHDENDTKGKGGSDIIELGRKRLHLEFSNILLISILKFEDEREENAIDRWLLELNKCR